MSRNIATTFDHAPAFQPTTEDCDALLARLDGPDLEATVTVSPEAHQRLLASAFALSPEGEGPRPLTDDEITIQAPAPVTTLAVRMATRPAAPPLHLRPLPRAYPRTLAVDAEASVEQVARAASAPLLEKNPQLLVVAGIWAMALSLCAMLAVMATG